MTGFRYCFGPVGSWRLGASLGIDPVSQPGKVCTFDCVYCQLGTRPAQAPCRASYVRPEDLGAELARIKAPADYLTFSGGCEPTMASNLTELRIKCGRHRPEKTAIITNASLIYSEKVREELAAFDFVIAKLDAPDNSLFKAINRPGPGVSFEEIVKGLVLFSKGRRGRLAIQSMFIAPNQAAARSLAALYAEIAPDEVQLNTPLRPCGVKPLSKEELAPVRGGIAAELERLGAGRIKITDVYSQSAPDVVPVSAPDTLRRRGKSGG